MAIFIISTAGNKNGQTAFLLVTCPTGVWAPAGTAARKIGTSKYALDYVSDPTGGSKTPCQWSLDFDWDDAEPARTITVVFMDGGGGTIEEDITHIQGGRP